MSDKLCKCGCGEIISSMSKDGTKRDFIHGHNSRMRENEWSRNPNSKNKRTGRWRARRIINAEHCALEYTLECLGRIEIHHIDGNACNNSPDNITAVCKSHHAFLDRGRITLENPKIPEYRVDGSGKRRYKTCPKS